MATGIKSKWMKLAKRGAGFGLGGLMHFAGFVFDSPALNMMASSYNTRFKATIEKRRKAGFDLAKREMEQKNKTKSFIILFD